MLNDLLIWGALLVGLVLLVVDRRRGIGALTLAYFLLLSLGHVPGILAYLDLDMVSAKAEAATKVGFDVTLIGMTAFIVGAIAARILRRRTTSKKTHQQTVSADIFQWLSWRVLTIGLVSSFVLLPVSGRVPSLTAVSSVFGTFLILGVCLQLYAAVSANDRRKTLLIVAALPLLPLATLTMSGFIGFGMVSVLTVVSFHFVIARRRIWFYLATPFVLFLSLSLFVTYAQQRDDIRATVWNQSVDLMQRLEKVSGLVTDFQLLDLTNDNHRFGLDQRLNQNSLVGAGVMAHQNGEVGLLYGATVQLWVLIPRAIWPDKPDVGGGGNVVSEFTGIRFEEGTSVGIGQVLEFYANFGMPGVLAGFAVFGFILVRLDQAVMRALAMRNMSGVLQAALPGLLLLNPLGNLMETVVVVVAAIITSRLVVRTNLLASRPPQRLKTKMSEETMRVIGRR